MFAIRDPPEKSSTPQAAVQTGPDELAMLTFILITTSVAERKKSGRVFHLT